MVARGTEVGFRESSTILSVADKNTCSRHLVPQGRGPFEVLWSAARGWDCERAMWRRSLEPFLLLRNTKT